METISSVKADLAKGIIAAFCFAIIVDGKVVIAPPWGLIAYMIPVAFLVWFGLLMRESLRYKREREHASFWGIWQRPIIAVVGFLMPFVIFFF